MEVQKYLERIQFRGTPNVSLDCLTRLQICHQVNIPYNNLSVFEKRKKVLHLPSLYQLVVEEGRGGWCTELNGLFAWLLSEIGFSVRHISADHYVEHKQAYNDGDHLLLLVYLEQETYLAEVGWGMPNQPLRPIKMRLHNEVKQEGGLYRLVEEGPYWLLQHKRRGITGHHRPEKNRDPGDWYPMYRFTLGARKLVDFQEKSDSLETTPGSMLASVPIVVIKRNGGKEICIITGKRFTCIQLEENMDVRKNRLDLSDQELNGIFRDVFRIENDNPLNVQKIMDELVMPAPKKEILLELMD